MQKWRLIGLWLGMLFAQSLYANDTKEVNGLCKKLAQKLSSVSYADCVAMDFGVYKMRSRRNAPLLIKAYKADANKAAPKILFMGGMHGDEFSSVSATFKWMKILSAHHSGAYEWLFLPLVNPDGLFSKKSQRMNGHDVDLNRNFPAESPSASMEYWKVKENKDPRRYPGSEPASEPETKAVMAIIQSFKPNVIVSVHAPYDLLDFDGGAFAPKKFGPLDLKPLGTYPGSLGNYAWLALSIPVITIELPNADVMPVETEVNDIWTDFVHWLKYDQPKMQQNQHVATNEVNVKENGIR